MNLSQREKQMTAGASLSGASLSDRDKWNSIKWKDIYKNVHRLQMRIVKAMKEKRWNKVKSLQKLLTTSLSAKL